MPPFNYVGGNDKLVSCCADIEALHESEEVQGYSFGKFSTSCHLGSLLLLKLPCTTAGSPSDMQHDTETLKLQAFLNLPPLQIRGPAPSMVASQHWRATGRLTCQRCQPERLQLVPQRPASHPGAPLRCPTEPPQVQ